MIRSLCLAVFVTLICVSPSFAVLPEEMLPNAGQEARARDISAGLRCLVCQNQSIDDSNASLAKDLRMIVRERIVAGDSDAQVTNYVVERYGHYVLLKPPFQADTALLWILPFALLALALGIAFKILRQNGVPSDADAPNDIFNVSEK